MITIIKFFILYQFTIASMNNTNKNNKLVGKERRRWSEQYNRTVMYSKVFTKLQKALKKHNKGLAKEKQISQVKAVSDAVESWLKTNPL